jgi:hypothetical protein
LSHFCALAATPFDQLAAIVVGLVLSVGVIVAIFCSPRVRPLGPGKTEPPQRFRYLRAVAADLMTRYGYQSRRLESTMNDSERMKLIAQMGLSIATIDGALKSRDAGKAATAFVQFMGAAGFLAHEIDELNNANAN